MRFEYQGGGRATIVGYSWEIRRLLECCMKLDKTELSGLSYSEKQTFHDFVKGFPEEIKNQQTSPMEEFLGRRTQGED